MGDVVVERKVQYLGSWSHKTVNADVIKQINHQIAKGTGHKVKLQLWRDGIRVVKTSIMLGKMLREFIPFPTIHFLTVSENTPDFLVVIAKSPNKNYQYEIYGFRCANPLDASMFLEGFRRVTKTMQPGHGYNPDIKSHDGINWTLRESQKGDDTKRDLNNFVNIHEDKQIIHSNGGVKVNINSNQALQNGQASPNEYKIHMYRKGKPAHVQKSYEYVTVANPADISDTRSEVSESALRTELESLSQELKDIKLMIEKSTGLKAEERTTTVTSTNASRDFEPLHIKVHTTTHNEVVENHVESPKTPKVLAALDAVVQYEDDEPSETVTKTTYAVQRTQDDPNVVRVSVPDYRTPTERVSTTSNTYHVTSSGVTAYNDSSSVGTGERLVAKRADTSGYGSISSGTSTMSYDQWKRQTLNGDVSERIQWRSRAHTTPRPRTAIPSFSGDSTDGSYVQVRHHTTHVGPAYQRVSFDPRVSRVGERKVKSLKMRGVSTTVPKKIEKVYEGYVREGHHSSLVYRPASVRPALVVQNGPIENGNVVLQTEQNNNVVKIENSDNALLDVSGIDLYKETPSSQQAVIRT